MTDAPPTVTCPGCQQAVEVDYLKARTLDGTVYYIRRQTDHDALLEHMDDCPNVTRTS